MEYRKNDMPVEEELARISPKREMLLTLGVFDGVHKGHKFLISQLMNRAKEANLLAGIVTLSQPPEELFNPAIKVPYLTTLEDRLDLLRATGADLVIPLIFGQDIATLTAREFILLLMRFLKMRGLVIGEDFALGKMRRGNPAYLARLGKEMGFGVTVVPPVILNGEIISSTAVRRALAAGDMDKVFDLLGRPFSLMGKVVAGTGRGKTLGFPTANLDVPAEQALPEDGVYATFTEIDKEKFASVTNIGTNPTFNGGQRTVETFVIDYTGNLYDRTIRLHFIARLRGEKKFTSSEALGAQIKVDIIKGKRILSSARG
jgi:riboflavin kinase / FMN adenylyltransferase